jgi:hypothetical protein
MWGERLFATASSSGLEVRRWRPAGAGMIASSILTNSGWNSCSKASLGVGFLVCISVLMVVPYSYNRLVFKNQEIAGLSPKSLGRPSLTTLLDYQFEIAVKAKSPDKSGV